MHGGVKVKLLARDVREATGHTGCRIVAREQREFCPLY